MVCTEANKPSPPLSHPMGEGEPTALCLEDGVVPTMCWPQCIFLRLIGRLMRVWWILNPPYSRRGAKECTRRCCAWVVSRNLLVH